MSHQSNPSWFLNLTAETSLLEFSVNLSVVGVELILSFVIETAPGQPPTNTHACISKSSTVQRYQLVGKISSVSCHLIKPLYCASIHKILSLCVKIPYSLIRLCSCNFWGRRRVVFNLSVFADFWTKQLMLAIVEGKHCEDLPWGLSLRVQFYRSSSQDTGEVKFPNSVCKFKLRLISALCVIIAGPISLFFFSICISPRPLTLVSHWLTQLRLHVHKQPSCFIFGLAPRRAQHFSSHMGIILWFPCSLNSIFIFPFPPSSTPAPAETLTVSLLLFFHQSLLTAWK